MSPPHNITHHFHFEWRGHVTMYLWWHVKVFPWHFCKIFECRCVWKTTFWKHWNFFVIFRRFFEFRFFYFLFLLMAVFTCFRNSGPHRNAVCCFRIVAIKVSSNSWIAQSVQSSKLVVQWKYFGFPSHTQKFLCNLLNPLGSMWNTRLWLSASIRSRPAQVLCLGPLLGVPSSTLRSQFSTKLLWCKDTQKARVLLLASFHLAAPHITASGIDKII